MRTIRIHVDTALAIGDETSLPPQAATHVARVLRLRTGAELILFNGDGNDYAAELIAVGQGGVRARIASRHPVGVESPLAITLVQALARGEKMDWIVQKATELGVARIVPLLTERGEVRLDAGRAQKRLAHWGAVIAAACEQCGRARLPQIVAPQTLDAWLASLDRTPVTTRVALLTGGEVSLRALDIPAPPVLLAVGPEGGFGGRDKVALRTAGFRGVRLGPRVLRTETAGVAALAALQALYGDF